MLKTIVATIARYVMFRSTDMCTVFQECVVLEECPGYHPSYRRGLYSAEILKTVVATNSKYALFDVSCKYPGLPSDNSFPCESL